MFVVYLIPSAEPWKVFSMSSDALNFADEQIADDAAARVEIYEVENAKDDQAAIDAVESGKAKFVLARGAKPSEKQIRDAKFPRI
jgi:hypothetical protein